MDLEATFEQLPVGVAHSDCAGRIPRFNTTFCTMLGFTPEELTAKTFSQILGEHRQTVEELASLRESLKRVIGIVATQQRHLRPRTAAQEGPGA